MRLLLVVSLFLLLSCGAGTVTPGSLVSAVQVVEAAASVAVVTAAALQASGTISVSDAQAVETAGASVASACNLSITELDSTDTNAVMVVKITSYFATVVLNTTGVSPTAAALVVAMAAAIQVLLRQLQSPPVVAAARTSLPLTTILTSKDKKMLRVVQTQAKQTIVFALDWKPVVH